MDPRTLYDLLLEYYGRQAWWPAEHPFEMMVGAVLVQNTAWTNAARAIAQLKAAQVLAPEPLATLGDTELQALIRPSGTFRIKAQRLKNLATALMELGGLDRLEDMSSATARVFLMSINGIGAETADAILVYGLHRPAFVVDAYARRLGQRITGQAHADQSLRELMHSAFSDSAAFGELHALIVAHGKRHCGARPVCRDCPLLSGCVTGRLWSADNQCSGR